VRNTRLMSTAEALQNDDVITVDVSRGSEGVAFELYPLSGNYLRSVAPDVHLWPRVFIARETESDFNQLGESLQAQVVQLLTGMPLQRLHGFGLRVEFVDVRSDELLATFDPAADPATLSASD
jgi:hypothetical protein